MIEGQASPPRDSEPTRLLARAIRAGRETVTGYVVDETDLSRRFAVEILVDGLQIEVALADQFSDELSRRGVGDACYGFAFVLRPALVDVARMVEIRLANLGAAVGAPLMLDEIEGRSASLGEARWAGGLHLTGWIGRDDAEAPRVCVFVDGEPIAEGRANRWRHVDRPRPTAVRAFDLWLPLRFADGRVWRATVALDDGQELPGSPVTFVAFERSLETVLRRLADTPGQRLQGALYDQLMPQSLPFSLYKMERALFEPEPAPRSDAPACVVLFDGDSLQASADSLEAQSHARWTAGVVSAFRGGFEFDAADLGDFFLEHAAEAEFFIFALPGVVFESDAIARIIACFETSADAALVYGDIDFIASDGTLWPVAFSAFDYERLLEQGYFAGIFAVRRATVETAIEKGVGNVFRLANIGFDGGVRPGAVRHLPGAIARAPDQVFAGSQASLRAATADHLAARGFDADFGEGFGSRFPACRVVRRFPQKPSVSIVVATRNRPDSLRACLASIAAGAARADAEIIVIDNDSSGPAARDHLAAIGRAGVKVLSARGPFNFSRLNNLAAAEARSDHLCFLGDDVEAGDDSWLEEMLSRHRDDAVGAVGAALLWPSGVVQHAGFVLGVHFGASPAFADRLDGDPGYADLLKVAHSPSAVSAACMTTPRRLFLSLGGFDEIAFPVAFSDVDFCLKLRNAGRNVVMTPHARLTRRKPPAPARNDGPDDAARSSRELRALRSKWGSVLAADPGYSPILSLDDPPYAGLAWAPRSLAARTDAVPPPAQIPPGM